MRNSACAQAHRRRVASTTVPRPCVAHIGHGLCIEVTQRVRVDRDEGRISRKGIREVAHVRETLLSSATASPTVEVENQRQWIRHGKVGGGKVDAERAVDAVDAQRE